MTRHPTFCEIHCRDIFTVVSKDEQGQSCSDHNSLHPWQFSAELHMQNWHISNFAKTLFNILRYKLVYNKYYHNKYKKKIKTVYLFKESIIKKNAKTCIEKCWIFLVKKWILITMNNIHQLTIEHCIWWNYSNKPLVIWEYEVFTVCKKKIKLQRIEQWCFRKKKIATPIHNHIKVTQLRKHGKKRHNSVFNENSDKNVA